MCLRANQYRDKERLKRTRNKQRQRYYSKTAGYEPRHWSDREEDLILNDVFTDHELSSMLGRSVGAIQKRRDLIRKDVGKLLKFAQKEGLFVS